LVIRIQHNLKKAITLLLIFLSINLIAQEKTFIKEYTYNASDIDSKVSSRASAINEVKKLLLSEVGVYIESESILTTSDVGEEFSQDFVENITTIVAGVTRLEVLDETWNGEVYWMKASITVDLKSVKESLKRIIADKSKVEELRETKRKLRETEKELTRIKKEFENINQENSKRVVDEYNSKINELSALEWHNSGYEKAIYGDAKGALLDFSNAIELDPNYALAYYNRGISRGKLGDKVGSVQDYTRAIELDPKHSSAYHGRGNSKAILGDHKGAILDFTKTIELDPQNANAYGSMGASKYVLGDHKGAILDFTKTIELDPQNANAYGIRGIIKLIFDDIDGACLDWIRAGELGDDKADDLIREHCQ